MKKFAIRIEEIQADGSRMPLANLDRVGKDGEIHVTGFLFIGINEECSDKTTIARSISIPDIGNVLASHDDLASAALRAVKIAAIHERSKNGGAKNEVHYQD